MICLGCSGDNAMVNTKAGEKRRRKMEEFSKKAELARKAHKGKGASR
jgi:hypothetical protein